MADSNQSNKNPQSKEMSMEMRLLLALALMGMVLFVTPYILKTTTPQPAKKAATTETKATPDSAKPAESAKSAAETPAAQAAPAGAIAAERQDDNIVIDTELYRVQFSNRGATVRSWRLKKFLDSNRKPVELVNDAAGKAIGYPFTVIAKGAELPANPNAALYQVRRSADGLLVDFEYSDGKIHSKKSFAFEPNKYVVQVTSELREQGREVPHMLAWRGGFGDFQAVNALSAQKTLYFESSANSLETKDVSDAKNGTFSTSGRFLFAGIQDAYFAAVVVPPPGSEIEVQTWSDQVPFGPENKEEAHVGVAIGGSATNRFSTFVGPKDLDILRSVDPRLEQVVDFGWFWFIARPLFTALHWLHDHVVPNWGWAIVILTVFINILLLPLKISNVKSMKKMSALQPQVQAIQQRYANLSMRDPRRQEQQQEVMALYQKHGVNPLGGCGPMLLQLPFFLAFYNVLSSATELRGADWLWVSDLSQPETLALRVLPLATIATQFVMQRMTPTTTADPQQQRIMQLMPLMFIIFFWNVAAGLVLYWFTGNVVGIVQQWYFNKTMGLGTPAPQTAAATQPKKRK